MTPHFAAVRPRPGEERGGGATARARRRPAPSQHRRTAARSMVLTRHPLISLPAISIIHACLLCLGAAIGSGFGTKAFLKPEGTPLLRKRAKCDRNLGASWQLADPLHFNLFLKMVCYHRPRVEDGGSANLFPASRRVAHTPITGQHPVQTLGTPPPSPPIGLAADPKTCDG